MTAEEQDACLEKILSGEIRGTMQDIQAQKSMETDNIVEKNSVEVSENNSFADENEEKDGELQKKCRKKIRVWRKN